MFPFMVVFMALSIPILAVLSKSEIGHALADAIRHNSGASKSVAKRRELDEMREELLQMRAELDEVHLHMTETAERLDFAERLLAKPTAGYPREEH